MDKRIVTGMCVFLIGLMAIGCAKKEEGGGAAAPDAPSTAQAEKKPSAPSQGKYADVRKINEEFVTCMETYISDVDKAANASEIAGAMDAFSDKMEKLTPQMKVVMEKYPELQNAETMPPELKDVEDRAAEVASKMMGAMMKIGPHLMDPEVKKAQERFMKSMQSLQQEGEGAMPQQ